MIAERKILVVAHSEELSRVAAEEFVVNAETSVRKNGFFTVALSGGSTPKGLYMKLAGEPYREKIPWSKVHFFWGDERCVPPDHPDSNYRMARESLLDKVPIPEVNIYRMPAELEDHDRAASEYEQTIRAFFHLEAGEKPRFDMVLLGMGDDGHTASLFPRTSALEERDHLVSANYIEKLSAWRLTLTVPVINQAAQVLFLISGESKASVLKEVLEGDFQPHRLPSQLIRPVHGSLLFIADSLAAGKLSHW